MAATRRWRLRSQEPQRTIPHNGDTALSVTPLDVAFLVFGLTVLAALIARMVSTPSPVVFAATGIGAGLAWHLFALPPVVMPPDLVLFVFLPPLLTTAAYALPLQSFRRNLLPIALLAVGLVLVTMVVAAAVGHWVAGLGWAAALVLGAIVAPPDPVAATAVAGKTGLSHRLVVILEGEGLVNDAVAIVAFGIALTAAVSGHFTWTDAWLQLLWQVPVGIAVGFAAGWGTRAVRKRVDSVPLEVGISVVTPYLAYHVADRLGGSGVLAVVTLGFLLRRYSTHIQSPAARLAARTVWGAFRYASTALVFLLLGLLIGEISVAWPGWSMFEAGLVLAGAVVGVRLVWMWTVPRLFAAGRHAAQPTTGWREQTVLGWAGMRGVVSLALALALPLSVGGTGETRSTIIFMTFVVIFATLLVQGVTLLPLVNWLQVGDPRREARDESRARRRARRAGVSALRQGLRSSDLSREHRESLIRRMADGSIGIAAAGEDAGRPGDREVLLVALDAQRKAIDRMRDAGQLGESLAERLDTELDLDEMGVSGEGDRLTSADQD
jgi:CPA1 family monovalent cation:H+ antiporter